MELAFDTRGDVTVVRVKEAKLTYPVLSAFFSEVQQRVEGGARKVVIDLQGVGYLDSASTGCSRRRGGPCDSPGSSRAWRR
jgi:anti-anti-sigma regulatory factor